VRAMSALRRAWVRRGPCRSHKRSRSREGVGERIVKRDVTEDAKLFARRRDEKHRMSGRVTGRGDCADAWQELLTIVKKANAIVQWRASGLKHVGNAVWRHRKRIADVQAEKRGVTRPP